jgi:ATP-dependent exoDNAse (exonuclease V) beta subunit
VVHAWLQRMAEDELRGWDAKRVASLRPLFVAELLRRGVSPADVQGAADLVAAALANALADERGRWVLGKHPLARNEYRLRNRERRFRIDRYIEDADGKKWVVDYKTSAHEGAGLEAFLDEQRERYAAQLDAYAEALGGAGRGLYFPLQKGWREWTD